MGIKSLSQIEDAAQLQSFTKNESAALWDLARITKNPLIPIFYLFIYPYCLHWTALAITIGSILGVVALLDTTHVIVAMNYGLPAALLFAAAFILHYRGWTKWETERHSHSPHRTSADDLAYMPDTDFAQNILGLLDNMRTQLSDNTIHLQIRIADDVAFIFVHDTKNSRLCYLGHQPPHT